MRKVIYIALCALLMLACGNNETTKKKGRLMSELTLKGDSTLYGLACEGCNDSTLVFMQFDGSDPVNYNIYQAFRQHRIFGDISTGDWIAVVLNQKDTTVADIVINLDELKGTWCYTVMPELRDSEHMPKQLQEKIKAGMPDSLRDLYFVPREYGFTLKRHYQASAVGYVNTSASLDNDSPVEYPKPPMYTAWRILNGQLVLIESKMVGTGDSAKAVPVKNDTTQLVFMRGDSLVLNHNGVLRAYHRRADAASANAQARTAAEKQAKKAIEETKN